MPTTNHHLWFDEWEDGRAGPHPRTVAPRPDVFDEESDERGSQREDTGAARAGEDGELSEDEAYYGQRKVPYEQREVSTHWCQSSVSVTVWDESRSWSQVASGASSGGFRGEDKGLRGEDKAALQRELLDVVDRIVRGRVAVDDEVKARVVRQLGLSFSFSSSPSSSSSRLVDEVPTPWAAPPKSRAVVETDDETADLSEEDVADDDSDGVGFEEEEEDDDDDDNDDERPRGGPSESFSPLTEEWATPRREWRRKDEDEDEDEDEDDEWIDGDDDRGYGALRVTRDEFAQLEHVLPPEDREVDDDEEDVSAVIDVDWSYDAERLAAAMGASAVANLSPWDESVALGAFNVRVVFEQLRTGFESSKDLAPAARSVLAGRYEIMGFIGDAAFSSTYACLDLFPADQTSSTTQKDGSSSSRTKTDARKNTKNATRRAPTTTRSRKTAAAAAAAAEDRRTRPRAASTKRRRVCLKIIKNQKDFVDQSLDEIKLLRYLNAAGDVDAHRVVRLYDYFYYKEHLILVTELLRENLHDYANINKKTRRGAGPSAYFTVPRLGRIAADTLQALSYVHSLGLIHADVKPENIVLASYDPCSVKLIDFGSSCFASDRLSSYVQSRSYRAPEVLLGLPYSAKIDVWWVCGRRRARIII